MSLDGQGWSGICEQLWPGICEQHWTNAFNRSSSMDFLTIDVRNWINRHGYVVATFVILLQLCDPPKRPKLRNVDLYEDDKEV